MVVLMKSTGIVRKLDKLGRIVVPKEVRKRLKIENGDLVDIFVEEEKIVITKFHHLDYDYQLIHSFCNSLKDVYKMDIVITNKTNVIYSSLNIGTNMKIDNDFLKRVNSYLNKELSSHNKIKLTDSYLIEKNFIINKILTNDSEFGYLIIIDNMISNKQKDLANLILNYLNKIL